MTHKYKVGDKVKIHSLDWFERNCICINDSDFVHKNFGVKGFSAHIIPDMWKKMEQSVIIRSLIPMNYSYTIDQYSWTWQEWMFEDSRQIKLKLLRDLF
jgi:hypothetical protein